MLNGAQLAESAMGKACCVAEVGGSGRGGRIDGDLASIVRVRII